MNCFYCPINPTLFLVLLKASQEKGQRGEKGEDTTLMAESEDEPESLDKSERGE